MEGKPKWAMSVTPPGDGRMLIIIASLHCSNGNRQRCLKDERHWRRDGETSAAAVVHPISAYAMLISFPSSPLDLPCERESGWIVSHPYMVVGGPIASAIQYRSPPHP